MPTIGWRKRIFFRPIQMLSTTNGIQREFNCRYTPEQIDVAKRKNRTVVDATHAMLEEKSMPKFYWAEPIQTTVYIQNRIGDKVSAHELYFGRKPNLRHLRVFKSISYVHVPNKKRRNLDPKSEKCILVDYSHEQKVISVIILDKTSSSQSRCCPQRVGVLVCSSDANPELQSDH